MIRIVSYRPEHYEQLERGDWHKNEPCLPPSGRAVTFLVNDKPMAIVGAYQVLPGVAQLWAYVSKQVDKRFARIAKLALEYFMLNESLRRVQMTVRADYAKGKRFARFLGFEPEAIMQKYGTDGSNYWLYAKVQS